jgi:hypothetical protein
MDLRVGLLFATKRVSLGNGGAGGHTFAGLEEEDGVAPDCILPAQYFARSKRQFSSGAEGRLMLAVLEDAVNCYLRTMNRRNREVSLEFREVSDWFAAGNCEGVFAFEHICEVLGIDAGWVRRSLQRLRGLRGNPKGTRSRRSRRVNPTWKLSAKRRRTRFSRAGSTER